MSICLSICLSISTCAIIYICPAINLLASIYLYISLVAFFIHWLCMCTLYSTGPFPGSFHLLSLPVCMQIWKGRPGNLVASDRQRVDTWGWCPTKDLEALCCNVRPIVGCQSVHKAASYCSLLMTGGHVAGIIMVRHRLLCVYPQLSDITACDQLSQAILIHICISLLNSQI